MTARTLSIIAVFTLMLTMLVGCRMSATNDGSDSTTTTTQTTSTVAQTATTDADPLSSTTSTDTTPAATMTVAVTAQQAQEIALTDAGFDADEISGLRTEFDYDDRTPHYDVQFYQGAIEYDYEIDAQTGAILEKDRDIED